MDQCREVLADFDGPVLVTYADTPLFRVETFKAVLSFIKTGAAATVITAEFADPTGYAHSDDR